MRQVEEVWRMYPEHCSLIWMLQIFELFQIFNEPISLRRLSSTGGIEEVRALSTQRTYVVGSSQVRGDFMHTRGIITENLDRLHTQVKTVWVQHAARPHDHFWTTPFSRDFFVGYSRPHLPAANPLQGQGFLLPGQEIPTYEKKRGRVKTSFTSGQPPLVFSQPLTHGETPFGRLQQHGGRPQNWPKMTDPQGKPRMLCFACSFAAPFNHCPDPKTCGVRYVHKRLTTKTPTTPSTTLSRMHIDLDDPQWSTPSYPASKWNPLIDFVKANSDLIQPSPMKSV
jgi:hypothetical protein